MDTLCGGHYYALNPGRPWPALTIALSWSTRLLITATECIVLLAKMQNSEQICCNKNKNNTDNKAKLTPACYVRTIIIMRRPLLRSSFTIRTLAGRGHGLVELSSWPTRLLVTAKLCPFYIIFGVFRNYFLKNCL
jgi:hypothetical protein